jgi:hypothetical protein
LQPDAQKKQIVGNIGVRAFQPLDKEMAKLAKRHALYLQSVNLLTEVRFAYDCAEGVMDQSSGKAGKTHYAVAVENGGAILSIRLNLSQHMAGIIPVLEGKLLVAYGVQHVVALQEAETLISQRGEKAKLTCFLDTNSFGTHDAFLKQPITMDSITWWAQVAKEADTALGKLLQALEIACKDPIFSAAFKARFSSILVQPDPASQVRDITAPSTWTMQDNAEQFQLVFRYNLNDGAQAGQAAAIKLASFVDVRLAQAVEAARKDAQEQLMKFRPTVQGTELTLNDFFPALSALKLDKGIEACKALKTWLAGMTRQLGLIVQRNPTVFKTKVRGIVFGLDPANGSKVTRETVVFGKCVNLFSLGRSGLHCGLRSRHVRADDCSEPGQRQQARRDRLAARGRSAGRHDGQFAGRSDCRDAAAQPVALQRSAHSRAGGESRFQL